MIFNRFHLIHIIFKLNISWTQICKTLSNVDFLKAAYIKDISDIVGGIRKILIVFPIINWRFIFTLDLNNCKFHILWEQFKYAFGWAGEFSVSFHEYTFLMLLLNRFIGNLQLLSYDEIPFYTLRSYVLKFSKFYNYLIILFSLQFWMNSISKIATMSIVKSYLSLVKSYIIVYDYILINIIYLSMFIASMNISSSESNKSENTEISKNTNNSNNSKNSKNSNNKKSDNKKKNQKIK